MGSGKTAIGRSLSSKLRYKFIDLDAYIEKELQLPITEIFKKHGEIYFRKKEIELLQTLINSDENFIIATGGGTVCYGNTIDILKNRSDLKVVYLKANVDTLTDRLFLERGHRPLISHLESKAALNDFIRKHLFERSFYYNQANFKVNVDALSVEEIVTNAEAILI